MSPKLESGDTAPRRTQNWMSDIAGTARKSVVRDIFYYSVTKIYRGRINSTIAAIGTRTETSLRFNENAKCARATARGVWRTFPRIPGAFSRTEPRKRNNSFRPPPRIWYMSVTVSAVRFEMSGLSDRTRDDAPREGDGSSRRSAMSHARAARETLRGRRGEEK